MRPPVRLPGRVTKVGEYAVDVATPDATYTFRRAASPDLRAGDSVTVVVRRRPTVSVTVEPAAPSSGADHVR